MELKLKDGRNVEFIKHLPERQVEVFFESGGDKQNMVVSLDEVEIPQTIVCPIYKKEISKELCTCTGAKAVYGDTTFDEHFPEMKRIESNPDNGWLCSECFHSYGENKYLPFV